jgi:hypothetical protein
MLFINRTECILCNQVTINMSCRAVRISFNEVVRCAVYAENTYVECMQEIAPLSLKEKPIVFKPRGQILAPLSEPKISILSMECTVESKPSAKIANKWHIDMHMRLYYEDGGHRANLIRTSRIIDIDGNIITTFSGSVYVLGEMDPLIKKRIANIDIPAADPLREETIHYLINAATDLYYSETPGRTN